MNVFVNVYESKNISRAAKSLFLTPQGCSKIIQKLEAELETSLFTRGRIGVEPTAQGDALYRQARAIIEILNGIKNDFDIIGMTKYALTIASTQGMSSYLSLKFMKDFTEQNPTINPRLLESPDHIAKNRLINNEAELGVLGGPIDLSVFRSIPFTRHYPCVVISKNNSLSEKEYITYQDLDYQPLALVSREFASYHLVINRFLNEGIHLNIVMEATEIDYCHILAGENEAIAISFDFAAWNNMQENTVIRPFADRDFLWETFIVYKADTNLSPQARCFCAFASDWLKVHEKDLFHWPTTDS
ncbi:MAG: LysR family transcriptional regulator [Raoultibacter sp.]